MRVLRRDDLPLAVRISGPDDTRPPVLLVHGMAGDHTTWRRFAAALRRSGRRVVSVDLRGHGRSGHADSYRLDDFRDDLQFVVDALGVERFDLLGHSLGAHTALRLAIAQPGRVRRLVLEEVPPMPRDDADVDEGVVVSAGLGERLRGVRDVVTNPYPFLRFDRSLPDQVGTQFQVPEPDWWDALPTVSAPTLVISGGRRSFLPPHHLQTLSEALPAGRFRIIDAGHSVHRDRPAEFETAATDFLAAE